MLLFVVCDVSEGNVYNSLMLTYKSYYNMASPYLCELINKQKSHVNTRLGTSVGTSASVHM